ncbi:glutaredoxin family protein [Catellatospora methionotrophica]|uniref:glutaredoxin family protein n=1 Tax=Catellatospora methionotrophica TaxID=121620 RepID=UPI001407C1C4|nr:glutaredoxin domain-containing protein [Catellatospora methionotrophica]
MARRWMLAVLFALVGLAMAARQVSTGSPGAGVALGLVFALLAVAVSPLVFPRSLAAAEAQRRSAADGRPIVYWRPGCQYCLRLRLRLGAQAHRVHWVDIWRDPDGAAAVRAITGGDETVPTVVVAGRPHVNPDPGWLRRQLA